MKGKDGTPTEGDNLTGLFPEDSSDITKQGDFFANGLIADAEDLIKNATWRCIYDLDMASAGDPVRVAMIAREEHYEDNPDSPLLMKFTYTDGFGRVAMEKTHAQEFSTPDVGTHNIAHS